MKNVPDRTTGRVLIQQRLAAPPIESLEPTCELVGEHVAVSQPTIQNWQELSLLGLPNQLGRDNTISKYR